MESFRDVYISVDINNPESYILRPNRLIDQIRREYAERCYGGDAWVSEIRDIKDRTPYFASRHDAGLYQVDCCVTMNLIQMFAGDIVCGCVVTDIIKPSIICKVDIRMDGWRKQPPMIITIEETEETRAVDVGSIIPIRLTKVQYETRQSYIIALGDLYIPTPSRKFYLGNSERGELARIWSHAIQTKLEAAEKTRQWFEETRKNNGPLTNFFDNLFGAVESELQIQGADLISLCDLATGKKEYKDYYVSFPAFGYSDLIIAQELAPNDVAARESMTIMLYEAVVVELLTEWERRMKFLCEMITTYAGPQIQDHATLWKMYSLRREKAKQKDDAQEKQPPARKKTHNKK